jgi:hypothetical protein
MKKFIATLSVLVLTACSHANVDAGQTIPIRNGDFEQAAADGSIPGWFITQHAGANDYEVRIEADGAHAGHGSLRITRIKEQVYGSILQRVPVDQFSGKTIELSAALKSKDVGPNGWKLFINGNSPNGLKYSSGQTGTNEWQQQSVTLKVTPNIHTVSIGATLIGAGSGWIDDVQLRVLDN